MDSSTFIAIQAPLKEKYKNDARTAFLTLKARARLGDEKITCNVETGRGLAIAGLHPMTGGTGHELCSGDMLLEALIACAGVAMKAAATVLGIPLASVEVFAEGDVDLRGALGVADDVPVGLTDIRLRFEVESDAPKSRLDDLLHLTERYCVIFHTLSSSPTIDVSMKIK